MPTVIDKLATDRDPLDVFVTKHRPNRVDWSDQFEKGKGLFQQGPKISREFYYLDSESDEEDGDLIAVILATEPSTIHVYDRAFFQDFVDIAERYEAYNQNARIFVIGERREEK